MIIKGLDNGYLFTKDNKYNLFKSAFSYTDTSLSDKSKITIDGVDYYFGHGSITAEIDKTNNLVNKICTLANLAMTGQDEYCLVVGLPINQYKKMKDKFKESILSYNKCNVIYDNKQFKPLIRDVTVFAQGAGSLFNIGLPDKQYISFDIGSYTINVVLIELIKGIPHIIKYDTWYDGVLTLYSKVISEVNRRFDLTLDIKDAENIIQNGLNVDGEKVNTDFIQSIKREYLENIFSKFKPNYPSYATTSIILNGGGAELLADLFERYTRNYIILPKSQFANSIGYYNFGVQKYGHLLERRRVNG